MKKNTKKNVCIYKNIVIKKIELYVVRFIKLDHHQNLSDPKKKNIYIVRHYILIYLC